MMRNPLVIRNVNTCYDNSNGAWTVIYPFNTIF